jgi:glycosyltransferase involved in cell wall biosynthesis
LGEHFGTESLRGRVYIRLAHFVVFFLCKSIHVHNYYTRTLIENKYKRNNGVIIIPHGNYIGYYPNQVSKSEARRHLDLPDDVFVYLFLGLLRPHKGLENLFEAFVQLKDPNTRLLVAGKVFGDISYMLKLRELIKNNSHIKLVPEFIPDEAIQLYMNACDVCVLPYKHITTSGAAALALSFGRPIIAPAITSFPEVVTPETGILYDISQNGALVSALREATAKSWSEDRILDYARQFDWDRLGFQLVDLYLTGSW